MSRTPPTKIVFDDFDELQAYSCAKGGKQAVLVRELLAGPVPFTLVPTGYMRVPDVRVYGRYAAASASSWNPLKARLRAEGFKFQTVRDQNGKDGFIVMWVDKSPLIR